MHILVAYDGSEPSREAVDAAANLAREMNAVEITLFTVVDPDAVSPTTIDDGAAGPPRSLVRAGAFGAPSISAEPNHAEPEQFAEDAAQAIERVQTETLAVLDELAREAFAGIDDVRTEVAIEGDAAAAIVRHAGAEQADLIVVGTHGRSGVRRALLGSVAESVVRGARMPVAVAGHHQ
jgi:nucleotide-binding universal stress UspA family protein